MKKTVAIIVLAVISLVLVGYIVYMKINTNILKPEEAQAKAEKFINDNLMQLGASITVGEVVEERGMYKMSIIIPGGTSVDSYMTMDGELFFPEALNIEEVTKELAANSLTNNNQNQMQLQTEILTEGTGDQTVQSGDSITVDYTGILEDGTQFDSSVGREPFTFDIGQGQVIQGWDQGLLGMKVGEERKLTIPSNMAYGSSGVGSIPPNSTLIFTVKLISIN